MLFAFIICQFQAFILPNVATTSDDVVIVFAFTCPATLLLPIACECFYAQRRAEKARYLCDVGTFHLLFLTADVDLSI